MKNWENLEIGLTVGGKWELMDLVTMGGGGPVYHCTTDDGSPFQLHFFSKSLIPDEAELKRRVARAAEVYKICPDVIIPPAGHGFHGDIPFVVYEASDLMPLNKLLSPGRMFKAKELSGVFEAIFMMLVLLHEEKHVHLGLSPLSIFLREGELSALNTVVLDWGFAPDRGHDFFTGPAFEQELVHIAAYASPEQAAVNMTPDHRSDLYSTAVIAYRLILGKEPFEAPNPGAILEKILSEMPEDLMQGIPGLNEDLAGFFRRALDKDPDRRFQNATDMMEAFLGTSGRQSLIPAPVKEEEKKVELPGPPQPLELPQDLRATLPGNDDEEEATVQWDSPEAMAAEIWAKSEGREPGVEKKQEEAARTVVEEKPEPAAEAAAGPSVEEKPEPAAQAAAEAPAEEKPEPAAEAAAGPAVEEEPEPAAQAAAEAPAEEEPEPAAEAAAGPAVEEEPEPAAESGAEDKALIEKKDDQKPAVPPISQLLAARASAARQKDKEPWMDSARVKSKAEEQAEKKEAAEIFKPKVKDDSKLLEKDSLEAQRLKELIAQKYGKDRKEEKEKQDDAAKKVDLKDLLYSKSPLDHAIKGTRAGPSKPPARPAGEKGGKIPAAMPPPPPVGVDKPAREAQAEEKTAPAGKAPAEDRPEPLAAAAAAPKHDLEEDFAPPSVGIMDRLQPILKDRKKLAIIGGAAAALIIIIVGVILAVSGGDKGDTKPEGQGLEAGETGGTGETEGSGQEQAEELSGQGEDESGEESGGQQEAETQETAETQEAGQTGEVEAEPEEEETAEASGQQEEEETETGEEEPEEKPGGKATSKPPSGKKKKPKGTGKKKKKGTDLEYLD